MTCVACGQPRHPLHGIRDICGDCLRRFPSVTRNAYRNDPKFTTRQAVDALRTRTASVKVFGGGRK
jgi:hypothetical protein